MRRSTALAAALALGIGYSAAEADIVTFEFLLDGGSITAADKVFSDFEVDDVVAFGASLPDYSQIDVESLDDGGLDPGPGLRFIFGDQLTVNGVTDSPNDPLFEVLELIDLTFSFNVTAADGYLIKDNSLVLDAELTAFQLDVGAFVLEQVFAPGDPLPIADKSAERSYLNLEGVEIEVDDPTDFAVFDPLQSIRVSKNIFVGATLDGEIADVISVEQRFSQQAVPLPATGLLLAAGLAGLTWLRRRA